MRSCKNCGEELIKNYCPNCGQKADVGRITLGPLIRDLPHAIFHVDKGFLFNVISLLRGPAQAIRDFLDGKRKPFFHPATFLVISLVVNYLIVRIIDLHFYFEDELATLQPLEAKAIKDYDAMQWWFLEHTYLYMLIAIPACSIFLYLFFRAFRFGFNLAECAVILMFIIAQGVFIQSALYLVTGWIHHGAFIRAVEVINGVFLLSYASYALFDLVKPRRRKILTGLACLFGGAVTLSLMIASAYWLLDLSK